MKLFPYQETGVDFLSKRKYALLADEQGIGKTAQAICAAKQLACQRILVICPASVKYNWDREITNWDSCTRVVINKTLDLIWRPRYTVINYDLIHRREFAKALLKETYDLIICDEAHYLKNSGAKRTKMVYGKGGLADRADRVWLLTGTPVMNRPVEVFPMLRRFIPDQLAKYADYMNFTRRYCAGYRGKFGWDASGASNIDELAKHLNDFMLRRTKQEVLPELPEKIFQKIEFDPPTKKVEKLLQNEREAFDLGAMATDRREVGMAKLPFVIEHLTNLLEEKDKVIVFAHHRDVLEALAWAFRSSGAVLVYGGITSKQKQTLVDEFVNNPKRRLFLGQIDSAGIGIDGLQKVADTIVFAEVSWVPGSIKQAIDRCHRIGQKNKVLVQFLMMKGGIDEQIFESIAEKTRVIKKLVETSNKEKKDMSIESTLERIAAALEAIRDSKAGPAVQSELKGQVGARTVVVPEGAGEPIDNAMFGDAPVETPKVKKAAKPVEKPAFKTTKEFLAYANKTIVAMEDKEKARQIVSEVTAAVQEAFGVATLTQIPVEKLTEAKAIFDGIVAA